MTSERAARYCVGGALVRAHFDLHGNPGYLTAEEEVRPARLELAIELLGRNAGRLLGRRVGWVLVEWELLAQKGDWDGVAAQLKPKEQAPTVSWLGLVVSLGDDRRIKHAELLAAYAAAIRELEANLADGGRGGQR